MKQFIYIILVIFIFYSCNQKIKNTERQRALGKDCNSIENIIGVVTLDEDNYRFGKKIFLYDKSKNLTDTIALKEEYQIFVLKCLKDDQKNYTVLYNNQIKYIPINDSLVKFKTWNNHFKEDVFSIDFNFEENPIRNSINGESLKIKKSNNYRISPIEIKGSWIKVKYEDFNNDKVTNGWVEWKNEKCILIEIFYFA